VGPTGLSAAGRVGAKRREWAAARDRLAAWKSPRIHRFRLRCPPKKRGPGVTAPDPLWTSQVVDGNTRPALIVARFRDVAGAAAAPAVQGGRRRMGAVESLRLARCPRCQRLFAICSHCDRGHVYCGPPCSLGARRDSLRRARRRHRCSPEGRLDHRDRERGRRRRKRLFRARVGDHPSATPSPEIKLVPALAPSGISTVETPTKRVEKVEIQDAPRPLPVAASFRVARDRYCRVCGSSGRWFRTAPVSPRRRGHPTASP
jgi:hypothetical protein